MYFGHPSVLVCVSSSQKGSLRHMLSCMPFFSFVQVGEHHNYTRVGCSKRVDVYLEGTYLSTLSMHFCLKVVQSVLASVSCMLACINSSVNSFKSSYIEHLSVRFHR